MGNLTYALSICVSSMDMDHLMVNASWLAGELSANDAERVLKRTVGSLLTILFDIFVSAGKCVFARADGEGVAGARTIWLL